MGSLLIIFSYQNLLLTCRFNQNMLKVILLIVFVIGVVPIPCQTHYNCVARFKNVCGVDYAGNRIMNYIDQCWACADSRVVSFTQQGCAYLNGDHNKFFPLRPSPKTNILPSYNRPWTLQPNSQISNQQFIWRNTGPQTSNQFTTFQPRPFYQTVIQNPNTQAKNGYTQFISSGAQIPYSSAAYPDWAQPNNWQQSYTNNPQLTGSRLTPKTNIQAKSSLIPTKRKD